MPRYQNRIQLPIDPNILTQRITEYMQREGFTLVDYKGFPMWRKGYGLMMGPQYFGISYGPDFIQIDAFIRNAILPGVYVGEMGIQGFYGALPKAKLRERVQSVEKYIYDLWHYAMAQQNAPMPPQGPQG